MRVIEICRHEFSGTCSASSGMAWRQRCVRASQILTSLSALRVMICASLSCMMTRRTGAKWPVSRPTGLFVYGVHSSASLSSEQVAMALKLLALKKEGRGGCTASTNPCTGRRAG